MNTLLTIARDGRLKASISTADIHSGKVSTEKGLALLFLNDKFPCELAANRATRERLKAILLEFWDSLDAGATAAIQTALDGWRHYQAPLRPLQPGQSTGYIQEAGTLECKTNFGQQGDFIAGHRYQVRTIDIEVMRLGTRLNIEGGTDSVEWYSRESAIGVTTEHGVELTFVEDRLRTEGCRLSRLSPGEKPGRADGLSLPFKGDFSVEQLREHFIIPDVLDVAGVDPDGYQRNLDLLTEIEEICV